MLDELKEEAIVNRVGGRFKLSTMIQKRLAMLSQGEKPLVNTRHTDKMAIVLQEILDDKIFLDKTGAIQAREKNEMDATRRAMEGDISGELGAD